MGRDILVRSTGKLIFYNKIQQAVLISQDSALVAGGVIGVAIKSLLLVFEKSHNLVFSRVMMTTQQDCTQNRSDEKTANEKEGE